MTEKTGLLTALRRIVGRRYLITGKIGKAPYCRGFRFGAGRAIAVVRPGSLPELWQVLQLCVEQDTAIIMQAANTGLTGGSTPLASYDRAAVVISTLRLDRIRHIVNSRQVVCLAGATLQTLETELKPAGRLPHSVLGSSCLGASVIGGICNNSGGSLVERGPAYTEYSLFARVTAAGTLELVNALGIKLGDTPETILRNLEAGNFGEADVTIDDRQASDREYATRVRDVDSDEPARYNADPRRLHEASGCAGKLAVFAVRLDTFPAYQREQTFFLSTDSPAHLAELRRKILSGLETLPVSGEYIHRDTMRLASQYGRDTVWMIDRLGTRRLPFLFRLRASVEAIATGYLRIPGSFIERCLQWSSRFLPSRLPEAVHQAVERQEHHLILKARDGGIAETRALLDDFCGNRDVHSITCSPREAQLVSHYRFAAAGAAIRYQACHQKRVAGIVALDIALPRNSRDWLERLPAALDARIEKKLYYGHLMCHVLHQDYLVRAGEDVGRVKADLLAFTAARGARFPAEHNHGHVYEAPPEVKAFYAATDPTNTFNPGVGGMSPRRHYE